MDSDFKIESVMFVNKEEEMFPKSVERMIGISSLLVTGGKYLKSKMASLSPRVFGGIVHHPSNLSACKWPLL